MKFWNDEECCFITFINSSEGLRAGLKNSKGGYSNIYADLSDDIYIRFLQFSTHVYRTEMF